MFCEEIVPKLTLRIKIRQEYLDSLSGDWEITDENYEIDTDARERIEGIVDAFCPPRNYRDSEMPPELNRLIDLLEN